MRVLVWIALAVLVYLALRKKINSAQQSTKQAPPPAKTSAGETMLACATCQVFIPASEAVMRGDIAYCCAEHASQSA